MFFDPTNSKKIIVTWILFHPPRFVCIIDLDEKKKHESLIIVCNRQTHYSITLCWGDFWHWILEMTVAYVTPDIRDESSAPRAKYSKETNKKTTRWLNRTTIAYLDLPSTIIFISFEVHLCQWTDKRFADVYLPHYRWQYSAFYEF